MVSTTLTAISATGQPTSSSSNHNYHHHHQSAINATATATATAATAANNSNYTRSTISVQQHQQHQQHQSQHYNHYQHHTSSSASTSQNNFYYNSLSLNGTGSAANVSTPNAATAAAAATSGDSFDVNARHHPDHHHHQRPPPPALSSSTTTTTATALYNGNRGFGETTKSDRQTKSPRNVEAKPALNLSEALLSESPPLNDQISLLFPKCRPKQQQVSTGNNNNNSHNHDNNNSSSKNHAPSNRTNGSECLDANETHTQRYDDKKNAAAVGIVAASATDAVAYEEDISSGSVINFCNKLQSSSPIRRKPPPSSTPPESASSTSYYKTVNIITQSPPPPSNSSISSESLSSVTPRISTNPFLCDSLVTTTEGDEGKKPAAITPPPHIDVVDEEEELPVPGPVYPASFYYHTEGQRRGGERERDNEKRSNYEMPRRRPNCINTYPTNNHSSPADASQQYAHVAHHQPQSQPQHNGSFSHNPFLRDSLWDQTIIVPDPDPNSIPKRGFRHLHSNAYILRSQPHPFFEGRGGPGNRSDYSQGETGSKGSSSYRQQAEDSYNPCPEELASLTNQYLYGSGSGGGRSRGSSNDINGASSWEKRDRVERERRDRERELHKAIAERERERDRERDRERERIQERDRERDREHENDPGRDRERERERENQREREKDKSRERMRDHDIRDIRDVRDVRDVQRQMMQRQQQKQQQQPPHPSSTGALKISPQVDSHPSLIANGEVIVFDDIVESWQNLRVTTAYDQGPMKHHTDKDNGLESMSQQQQLQQHLGSFAQMGIKSDRDRERERDREMTKTYLDKNYSPMAMETRHGIIEYEGSPRRFGQANSNAFSRENTQPQPQPTPKAVNSNKNNNNNTSVSYKASNSNSPQQQYPARPGFPKRIISPPRQSPPPMMMATKQQQPQPLQQPPHHSQSPIIDNNAEDTSNDVSEIGTISDLTGPEAFTAAAAGAATGGAPVTASASTTTDTTTTGAAAITLTTAGSGLSLPPKSSTFDYLYEFSETRKVLEEFFKCPSTDERAIENGSDVDSIDIQYEFHSNLGRDDDDDEDDAIDREEDDDEDDGDRDRVRDDDDEPDDDDDDNNDDDDDDNDNDDDDNVDSSDLPEPEHLKQRGVSHEQEATAIVTATAGTEAERQQQQRQSPPSPPPQYEEDQHLQQQQPQQKTRQQHHRPYNMMNHHRRLYTSSPLMRDFEFFLDSASRSSSGDRCDPQDGINHNEMDNRNQFRYSPETTDYDSNCGDLESLSGELNGISATYTNYNKYYATHMPTLEDGLSSGPPSDAENNNRNHTMSPRGSPQLQMQQQTSQEQQQLQQQQQGTVIHQTPIGGGISMLMDMKRMPSSNSANSMHNATPSPNAAESLCRKRSPTSPSMPIMPESTPSYIRKNESPIACVLDTEAVREIAMRAQLRETQAQAQVRDQRDPSPGSNAKMTSNKVFKNIDPELDSLYSISVFHRPDVAAQMTPPPPAPAPHRKPNVYRPETDNLQTTSTYKDMTTTNKKNGHSPGSTTPVPPAMVSVALSRAKSTPQSGNGSGGGIGNGNGSMTRSQPPPPPPIPERSGQRSPSPVISSPVWRPRHLDIGPNPNNKSLLTTPPAAGDSLDKNMSADEDDIDTDLETDRLLGHQRIDDQGYYEESKSWERKSRSLLSKISPKQNMTSTKTRNGYNALLSSTPENPPQPPPPPPPIPPKIGSNSNRLLDIGGSISSSEQSDKSPIKSIDVQDCIVTMGSPIGSDASGCMSGSTKKDLDLMGPMNSGQSTSSGVTSASNTTSGEKKVKKSKNKEGGAVLIEGVLFRAKYLGSTQLVCEGQPTKTTRMMQAEEAVSRIKALAPDGDVQPSTEVDLFISTEKIMVLNTDLKEIMMDHALRTISYIADIGDLVVLMARRRFVPQDIDDAPKPNRTPKMICHVFESDEAQFIAQSIGQAFQVAYMEFLKANGIEDHSFVKEMDYQEVLNSQEIFGDELEIFAKKELQKEVVVPKAKGEILGVVIVESGWGSMLPTVVIANLMSSGAAARCGQLNIGDQLIAINGLSLVGLPLSTCQNYIKNTKNQTVVKFTVVPCAPVVEVKIKRPNTKYQLGFSVQNGVICSLLRGGIAERGGVRVGHRIIEINNQSVVAVPHEKIVNLLATSVGEILMKTMPTSMFRLLTGQENPIYI